MNISEYSDPKNSLVLFELGNKLDFLIKLYNSNNPNQTAETPIKIEEYIVIFSNEGFK